MPTDAHWIEHRTVATGALAVRRSNHYATVDLIQTGLDLIRTRLDLILFVLRGKNSRHFFVYRMFTSEGGRDIWQTTVQIILAAPLLAVL